MRYEPKEMQSLLATNPLGMVDVVIQRDSTGSIAEITAYHEGDGVYDGHAKEFPQ